MNNQPPPLTITIPLLLEAYRSPQHPKGLNETTLASEINRLAGSEVISQTKIWRMRTGQSQQPRDSSVKPLADFFSLTIQQLKDIEFIEKYIENGMRVEGMQEELSSYIAIDHSKASFPQLLAWDNLAAWCKDPNYDSRETTYCPFESGPNAVAAAVTGDAMAMTPKYEPGEYVCFDPDVIAEDGNDVLVMTGDGKVLFRRIQRTLEGDHLLALNSDWPNRLIEMPENSTICAVLIGSWRE